MRFERGSIAYHLRKHAFVESSVGPGVGRRFRIHEVELPDCVDESVYFNSRGHGKLSSVYVSDLSAYVSASMSRRDATCCAHDTACSEGSADPPRTSDSLYSCGLCEAVRPCGESACSVEVPGVRSGCEPNSNVVSVSPDFFALCTDECAISPGVYVFSLSADMR